MGLASIILPAHAVGDGAAWIVGQVEAQFGGQARYVIDFYHVCEYLSAAASGIAPDAAVRDAWIETQKAALKTGRLDAVLQALAAHCEAPEVEDGHAPVRSLPRDNLDENRIASPRNAPEARERCLTRMLPSPRRPVNLRQV